MQVRSVKQHVHVNLSLRQKRQSEQEGNQHLLNLDRDRKSGLC